jgi:hypothetical protein
MIAVSGAMPFLFVLARAHLEQDFPIGCPSAEDGRRLGSAWTTVSTICRELRDRYRAFRARGLGATLASSRARTRSRRASWASWASSGTQTGVRSPVRSSRASLAASR